MSLFLATAVLIFVIGSFGIFGNVNLFIATTFRNPRKNKCTILIAILSCVDLICICFELQNATRMLLTSESSRLACFWAFSPYLFMINVQSTLMLMIALDRFLAMFIPVRYRSLSKTVYVLLALIPCFAFASAIFIGALFYMVDEPIKACNPPLMYPPVMASIWNRWIIISDSCTIVVYVITMIVLYVKKHQFEKLGCTSTEYHFFVQQHHIMRTIGVIVVAFLFSSFFCHCSVLFVTLIGLTEDVVQVFQTIAVIPALMCYSQNYYIYLWRSAEYRSSFKSQFLALIKCNWRYCSSSNSVSIVQSIYSSNN